MWLRSDLKSRAKKVMDLCYWKAVLVGLVMTFAIGSSSGNSFRVVYNNGYEYSRGIPHFSLGMLIAGLSAMSLGFIVAAGISIFLKAPLEVGADRFFLVSRVRDAQLNELGHGFAKNYPNVVKVQFMRSLYTWLWSLLFVIPGVIKSYEYRMIPFLLAENPDLEYQEAFRISRELMDGQKMETFILDLSFIGWLMLSGLTCGILSIFYVQPYYNLTYAELYVELQQKRYDRYNGPGANGNGANATGSPYGSSAPYMNNEDFMK